MTTTAQAAVVREFNADLRVEEVPLPALEPGAVLVSVDAATVCGTDHAIWQGGPAFGKSLPYIPGHETAGTVIEVAGDRFDVLGAPVVPGDRIIWSYPFCGECFYCCVAQRPTLCKRAARFGRSRSDVSPYLLGGFATHHYVPPKSGIIKIPDAVPAEIAAGTACSLRTVMHAFERLGQVAPYEIAVVQGAGSVGLYATAVAKASGFRAVLVIGAPADRLALARSFGADDVIDVDQTSEADRADWVRSWTGGRGADVVVEGASSRAIPEGLSLVREGGRFVAIGEGGVRDITIDSHFLHARMIDIVGVRSGEPRHYLAALRFVETRVPMVEKILSNRHFSLAESTAALESVPRMDFVKPVVIPG